MAYWINEYDTKNNVKSFYCDTEDDIKNLPTNKHEGVKQDRDEVAHKLCNKGSTCLVIETASIYILNSTGEWKQV